ncbi:hypothetical protein [Dysgonomonas sp. 25]|uniref:hypothetical protein n=1 Tax=Dysgonomonas sp. 25 TaxID=2302933 RepID=UPI0013D8528A|nr:hypothetical protein [Dysgonomonas sp. 25]NDV68614.1 hypothetical protein [Dysgonomonas sp. 25]
MSNKPSKLKSNKGKFTQIGNFLVSFEKGQFQSVKIMAASGNWNIRFREDNSLYQWILNQIKSEEGQKILQYVFAAYYAVCSGVPDNIFFEDILKAYQNSIDRISAANQELSENDDWQIINEEREKYNLFKRQ